MKLFIALTIALLSNTNSIAQHDTSVVNTTKTDLLLKSKNQRTTGWIMFAGGTIIAIAGYTTYVNHVQNSTSIWSFADGKGLLVGTVGLLIASGGGVFLRASKRNKNTAMSMTFTNQPLQFYRKAQISMATVPSITLVLQLAK